MSRGATFTLVAVLFVPVLAYSDTIIVPDDHPTIQGAIDVAVNGDTVLVKPGTYVENFDFIGKAITVMGEQGAGNTIIDGNQAGSVVNCKNGEGPDTVLEGFTITNGDDYYGGGIYCISSSPIITNNTITTNSVSGYFSSAGGGIYCTSSSSPTITNNTISDNTAKGSGGGIYCSSNSSPTITSNTITGNTSFFGGGILCTTESHTLIRENIISNNLASQQGGGVSLNENANAVVESNLITGNTSVFGGGLEIQNASPDVAGNIIALNGAGNIYSAYGGGIYCDGYSLRIYGNAIIGNTATTQGGGMWIGSDVKLLNNVIAYNSASEGGGISIRDCKPTLSNCTFFHNTAQMNGGAVLCFAKYSGNQLSVDLKNSILWKNTAPSGPQIWFGMNPPASLCELRISYSDVEGGLADVYVEPGCVLDWGPGMIDADPLFMNPLNNDFQLKQDPCQPGIVNPCVDSGSSPAWNFGLHECWTRSDGVPDAGVLDMGIHYGPFSFPALHLFDHEISASAGGFLLFKLYGGSENAGRYYILLGSLSGTSPGTPMPGGLVVLPLNFDVLTGIILSNLNVPPFNNFMEPLFSDGTANVYFSIGPIPSAVGLTAEFAYPLSNPFDFVSNPVTIAFVP